MKKDRKINENKIMKRLIKIRNAGGGICLKKTKKWKER